MVHSVVALAGDESPAGYLVRRLTVFAEADDEFRNWLLANGGTDNVEAAVRQLATNLPTLLLNWKKPPLPLAEDLVQRNLISAAHMAVRLRALERAYQADGSRRQQEALYHFAYGLSHELNNPLANISTRAGVLARDETDVARRKMLESIVENAMRGCEMLGDLMLIARPPQLEPEPVEVRPLIEQLLRQAIGWAQKYAVQISSCIKVTGKFHLDATAMREALWCLIRNSLEAVEQAGEIRITVRETDQRTLRLEVRDNGPGLSPEALEHCFDPFYCGREAGRGLGVGLTKARRIVELHGGSIELTNVPGGGCSAIVELPK